MSAAERARQVLGLVQEAGSNWPMHARQVRCLEAALAEAERDPEDDWTQRDRDGMDFLRQAVAVQLVDARGRA